MSQPVEDDAVIVAAPPAGPPPAHVPAGFRIAAVGDIIQTRPVLAQIERASPELVRLLQSADAVFGNYETSAFEFARSRGYSDAPNGGSPILSEPSGPKDLKVLGIDIVSRANNHVTDWGIEGMAMTDALLDEAGIAHAGSGNSLAAARAACFHDTGNVRVGLVAMASTFVPGARAGDPLGEVSGRPGLSALRLKRTFLVSPERLEQLAAIRRERPFDLMESPPTSTEVDFFGVNFRADTARTGLGVTFQMDARDTSEILAAVRQAKQTSDVVLATLHAHEPGNFSEIPDFEREIARQTIDAGADQFIGHGPHRLRGIEIYNGRPIFYSLGNFLFMLNDMSRLSPDFYELGAVPRSSGQSPADFSESFRQTWFGEACWWQSVVAVTRYGTNGLFDEILLYPVDLQGEGRVRDKGVPLLASREVGDKILAHLQDLSAPLGTVITIKNGVGVIRALTAH